MVTRQLISVIIGFVVILGHLGLSAYIFSKRPNTPVKRRLLMFVLFSTLVTVVHLFSITRLHFDILPLGMIVGVVYLISVGIFGTLTSAYLEIKRGNWLWIPSMVLICLLFIASSGIRIFPSVSTYTLRELLFGVNQLVGLFFLSSWLIFYFVMILLVSLAISRVTIPLQSNRLLWWILFLPSVAVSECIAIFAPAPFDSIGMLMRLIALFGVSYVVLFTHLLDIRNIIRLGIGNGLLITITSGIILMGVGVGQQVLADPNLAGMRGIMVLVVFSAILAIIYQILRDTIASLVEQLVLRFGFDAAKVAADYAKQIPNLLEYQELATAATRTFRDAIEARSGLLMLLTTSDNGIFSEVIPGSERVPTTPIEFRPGTPFLTLTGRTRQPVTQYEIEVDPSYRDLPVNEREWLSALKMDVFLPIFDNDTLIGMLGVGPRISGDPYRTRELDLMQAVANQTSVALKNARLFAQQRNLVDEMQRLNDELVGSNRRLEEMDQVKTDFLTIASHELRTPLTQVRGFSDVLDTLNEAGVLDRKQISEITQSLLRACDRLDSVIGQMLDVSQIDVDAMQLKFVETSLETVIRMAVEPYAPAILERKQKLTVRGISQVPTLMLDLQRSVQAFGQIISNAIKYTPDGGKIEISAERMPATSANEAESVLIKFRDTGVGIDPKYHELIFEKFFRIGSTALHSTSTTKFMGAGPGLGLPIARGVIKGHGGRIWVESLGFDRDACPGTTIFVVLPVRPPRITTGSQFSLQFDEMEGQ